MLGVLAGLAMMLVAGVLDHFVAERELARSRSHVTTVASQARARLEQELSATMNLCLGLVAYASARPQIDREEFEAIASVIVMRAKHVRNTALAPDNVVAHVYPLQGNEKVLGLNYLNVPAQRDAVLRAMESGKPVVAGPVNLTQGGRGVINRVPIFTSRDRDKPPRYWGIASVVLDLDSLLAAGGLTGNAQSVRFALRGTDGLGERGEVFFGPPELFRQDAVLLDITLIGDSRWQLAAWPEGGWKQRIDAGDRTLRFGLALVLAFGFGALVHAASRDKLSLERRVRERTAELERANFELEHAMQQLVHAEKLASLGSLVAGVAHELNTPIGNALMVATTLMGDVERLAKEIAGGAARRSVLEGQVRRLHEAAAMLEKNLLRSGELISGFKQVAVDQTSDRQRRFNLRETVDEIALTLRPTLNRTPYRLSCEIPAGIELDSYPGALGQVLTNLVNNAIVHGFEGRPAGAIHVAAQLDDADRVRMTVADDGRGMDAATLKRAFDPFFTTRLGTGGSGLGLYIAYNLVRGALGGRITAASTPDAGTKFELLLPIKAPPLQAGADPA